MYTRENAPKAVIAVSMGLCNLTKSNVLARSMGLIFLTNSTISLYSMIFTLKGEKRDSRVFLTNIHSVTTHNFQKSPVGPKKVPRCPMFPEKLKIFFQVGHLKTPCLGLKILRTFVCSFPPQVGH